jgi:hypothetical protein
MSVRTREMTSERAFVAAVVVVHAALALFAMLHHEMWRDELHSWLVARDSATPWAVVHNHRYDGHPPLWYLVLWVLTRVTWSPIAMQVLHIAIASANVFIVARFSPFPRVMRALFALGYFITYEYAAISRCYGLALLLVLLVCMHHPRRFERPVVTGVLLAALALTTTVATAVAAAYACTLVVELVARWRRGDAVRARDALPIALAAIGGALALAAGWPPPDSTVAHVGSAPPLPWTYAPTRVLAGVLPVPRPDFFFWNSNAILALLPDRGAAIASIALAAWLAFALVRRASSEPLESRLGPAMLFVVGSVLLMVVFGAIYAGDVRHHGFVFVLFVMGAWLGWRERSRWLAPTLAIVLLAHLPGTAIALALDAKYVFSSGKRAADVVRREGLAHAPIVAELDYPATAMLGQLGPGAFALSVRNGRRFSFVQWTGDRMWDPTDDQIVAFASATAASHGATSALLTTRPLPPRLIDGVNVVELAALVDSMIENENFFVYRVEPAAHTSAR